MLNTKFYNIFHKKNVIQNKFIQKNNFTYKHLINVLTKFILPDKNTTLLDIGCGSGTISIYLSKFSKKILSIDISEVAIAIARKSMIANKISNIKFEQMDFPTEYPKGKYTYIICFEVLEHIKNDKKALKIIYNLLENNGIAFISVPSSNAPLFKLGLAKNFDKKVGHLRRYSLTKITSLCKEAGFTVIETKLNEGIVRNSLFLLPIFSWLLRFIKYFIVEIIDTIDYISLKLFGESQIIIVVKK